MERANISRKLGRDIKVGDVLALITGGEIIDIKPYQGRKFERDLFPHGAMMVVYNNNAQTCDILENDRVYPVISP